MISGLEEGGRDVPDFPLKLDTIFVTSLLQDMVLREGHPASYCQRFYFSYAARKLLNWSNFGPRSEQQPWHYDWAASWLKVHPETLENNLWARHRVLYEAIREKVGPPSMVGVPASVWAAVQPVGLENGLKDLHWVCLHKSLPVREKMYRHGLSHSPLCPRLTCGAEETVHHVMWECSFARRVWVTARRVVRRAEPNFILTWEVVERGLAAANTSSRGRGLWLLLSLYKRELWLARQALVRKGQQWSVERLLEKVKWEMKERMKWDVQKLGYHAAKERWKGGFGWL
ncbi:hypothetical protein Q5P01_000336 [Channa striata]|uniref:Reverse transcriptase zinc-binding domain-containing protein n=1 Tax=Channa striata TaxID=64152 RepID=A0AA88IC66_CHASR|nr:hypothetical protein Q5P01_000336 [Channa striata]